MTQKISYDPPPVTEWQDLSAPVGPMVQPSPLEDMAAAFSTMGVDLHRSLERAYTHVWSGLRAGMTAWVDELKESFDEVSKAVEKVAEDLEPPKDRDRRVVPKHGSQGPRSGSTFDRRGRRTF